MKMKIKALFVICFAALCLNGCRTHLLEENSPPGDALPTITTPVTPVPGTR